MSLVETEISAFLIEKHDLYNRPEFIVNDPISVPHTFSIKEDVEIIGFLVATIAWGQRKTIINNGKKLAKAMGNNPYEFVMDYPNNEDSKDRIRAFKHRTFNGIDCDYFLNSLNNIYLKYNGLHGLFKKLVYECNGDIGKTISGFKQVFFELDHPLRVRKHVSDPMAGSAAKRLNMFLRWMVRNDNRGVDFGIWNDIDPKVLMMPLDVHTGTVGRKLGLLNRNQNDWKAVAELTNKLRGFDPYDPVKFDFALFGLGIEEKF
ncbi:MAG TPA: TIGR02757 family protein [Flavobacteriales bacterium]|nr:TIGR02757 family protein [Flavobacteriales bacterium]HIN40220.1 TIGR02757 family protein [Flavobacteriales bacterium]